MKRILILALSLLASSCALMGNHPNVVPDPALVTLSETPTTVQVETPDTNGASPDAAAISDNPLVRGLSELFSEQDADTAGRINDLTNDRIMKPCTAFASDAKVRQRVADLANFKNVLQVLPIKPVGPLSILAEARRVRRDVESGALSARIAEKRKELDVLDEDFLIACGALITDTRRKIVGAPIAALRAALGLR